MRAYGQHYSGDLGLVVYFWAVIFNILSFYHKSHFLTGESTLLWADQFYHSRSRWKKSWCSQLE